MSWLIFFCPKTTVLAEKLFHPADQRSTADSTLCDCVTCKSLPYQRWYQTDHSFSKFLQRNSISKRPRILLVSKLRLETSMNLYDLLSYIWYFFQRKYSISAKTVVLGQKSIIWSKQLRFEEDYQVVSTITFRSESSLEPKDSAVLARETCCS